MLVLSRKNKESVVVGGPAASSQLLKVTVLEIKNGSVRLGFEADASVPVHRSEVWERIRESHGAGGSPKNPRGGYGRLKNGASAMTGQEMPMANRGTDICPWRAHSSTDSTRTICGGGEWIVPVPFLYRPIRPRNAGSPRLPRIPPMRSIWRRAPVSSVIAINKAHASPYKDPRVIHVIDNGGKAAYRLAAEVANGSSCDVVSLQHEFGLYPGDWGVGVLDFVRACRKPLVTTFHTLMTEPTPVPRHLIRSLAAYSEGIIVMTQLAARLLADVYKISTERVRVIPHGVPEVLLKTTVRTRSTRTEGPQLICTFGLINRGKGLEYMIQAMPRIVASCPEALYLIVGVTHPEVKRQEGEALQREPGRDGRNARCRRARSVCEPISRAFRAYGVLASL